MDPYCGWTESTSWLVLYPAFTRILTTLQGLLMAPMFPPPPPQVFGELLCFGTPLVALKDIEPLSVNLTIPSQALHFLVELQCQAGPCRDAGSPTDCRSYPVAGFASCFSSGRLVCT